MSYVYYFLSRRNEKTFVDFLNLRAEIEKLFVIKIKVLSYLLLIAFNQDIILYVYQINKGLNFPPMVLITRTSLEFNNRQLCSPIRAIL